jgi:predicted ATP-grasp superfamily ATP-dependent carboligase
VSSKGRGSSKRVLILDGMWNKSLAAVRSFGKRGFSVTAGETTALCTALFSRYCTRRFIYPSLALEPHEFLRALERELKHHTYDALFAMEFSTQVFLTKGDNRSILDKYTHIPFIDAHQARKINDKAFVMDYARAQGIDIPETYFVHNKTLLSKIGEKIPYPVLIKPRVSSGSRGIVRVNTKEELLPVYEKVHKHYPFPLIQDYLPQEGDTYGVGLIVNNDSKVRASFVYKRLRHYPVTGGPSTLRESVKREDIRQIACSLMESLKWKGIAHVEFKIDVRDKKPKLLEINPRFWGSLELAIASGVDFPFLLYQLAVKGDISPPVHDYALGVRRRWLIPGDILHFLANPDRRKLNPGFFDFTVKDDILSLNDPFPVMGRILSIIPFLFHKDMRKLIKR